MTNVRTSRADTPTMTPVWERLGGPAATSGFAPPQEGPGGCGWYGCCPYWAPPGRCCAPGTRPCDCSAPLGPRWLGAEGCCGTYGLGWLYGLGAAPYGFCGGYGTGCAGGVYGGVPPGACWYGTGWAGCPYGACPPG